MATASDRIRKSLWEISPPWIRPDVAAGEIGAEEFQQLENLRCWLYGPDPDFRREFQIPFRTAPSIITRSECELFGVSYPRFAYRAYLTPDRASSFINARRIVPLAEAAVGWSLPSDVEEVEGVRSDQAFAQTVTVSDTIRRGSTCIADSLLRPPGRLRTSGRFQILSVCLSRAYGELSGNEPEPLLTPFLKHMRLGGGMCAQAACFMATCLLHRHTNGIFGISEITALSRNPNTSSLVLGGMKPFDIVTYFRHPSVGLWSSLQTTECVPAAPLLPGQKNPESPYHELGHTHLFALALRSYLRSGMPVILPVDLGRMQETSDADGDSIYARNAVKAPPRADSRRYPRNHCVVAIGCHQDHPWEFVVNDPASVPFLLATALQLVRARPYDDDADACTSKDLVRNYLAIPVTPGDVRLPLLNSLDRSRKPSAQFGLLSIAARVQSTSLEGGNALGSDFRLVYTGQSQAADLAGHGDVEFLPMEIRDRLVSLVGDQHWCWCQRQMMPQGMHFWIWDAHVEIPTPEMSFNVAALRDKYLLAEYRRSETSWETVFECPVPSLFVPVASQAVPAVERKGTVNLSLISSFTTGPCRVASSEWPSRTNPACELYTFMQPEVDAWTRRLDLPPCKSALEFMASVSGDDDIIASIAADVAARFSTKDVDIVALATFLPELAWPQDSTQADAARRSICFLSSFAAELQIQGHSTKTVELVGGSLIEGIWPGLPRDERIARPLADEQKRMFVARVTDEQSALWRLLDNLRSSLTSCRIDPLHTDAVTWAIELEPGPLFLVRDWITLERLCQAIGQDEVLRDRVGVNYDIAHWRLAARQASDLQAKITTEKIKQSDRLFSRLVHGHIAGHHPSGHFGDIPLGSLSPREDFRPWVELLFGRPIETDDRDGGCPGFSGYLSIEFEAAKHHDFVANSLDQLSWLLASLDEETEKR